MASDSEVSPFARAVLITLAVVVLYVLSIGPVYHAVQWRGYAIEDCTWLLVTYSPIIWLSHHSEPAHRAIKWYMHQWWT